MYVVDDTKVYTKDDMFKHFDVDLKKCIMAVVLGKVHSDSSGNISSQSAVGIYQAVNVADGRYSVDGSINNGYCNVGQSLSKKLKCENLDYINTCANLLAIKELLSNLKMVFAKTEAYDDYDIVIFNKYLDDLCSINEAKPAYGSHLDNCLGDVKHQFAIQNVWGHNVFIRSVEENTFDELYKHMVTTVCPSVCTFGNEIKRVVNTKER